MDEEESSNVSDLSMDKGKHKNGSTFMKKSSSTTAHGYDVSMAKSDIKYLSKNVVTFISPDKKKLAEGQDMTGRGGTENRMPLMRDANSSILSIEEAAANRRHSTHAS